MSRQVRARRSPGAPSPWPTMPSHLLELVAGFLHVFSISCIRKTCAHWRLACAAWRHLILGDGDIVSLCVPLQVESVWIVSEEAHDLRKLVNLKNARLHGDVLHEVVLPLLPTSLEKLEISFDLLMASATLWPSLRHLSNLNAVVLHITKGRQTHFSYNVNWISPANTVGLSTCLRAFLELPSLVNLVCVCTVLSLYDCYDDAINILVDVIAQSNLLTSVTLIDYDQPTPFHWAALTAMTQLKELVLQSKKAIKKHQLSCNSPEVRVLPHLKRLDLTGQPVFAHGLNLNLYPQLEWLCLYDTCVHNPVLEKIKACHTLQFVDLRDTHVTIDAIRMGLPAHLEVLF